MRFHSVFFKLNLIFAIALVAVLLAGGVTLRHLWRQDQADLLIRSRLLIREARTVGRTPKALMDEFGLVEVPRARWKALRRHARTRHASGDDHRHRIGAAHVFAKGGYLYVWIHARDFRIMLREKERFWSRRIGAIGIWGAMVLLLGVLYLLLRRSLMPIRTLQQEILRYGEGHVPHGERFSSRQDEIAQVGNAFYASAHRVRRLMQSRHLFVRNIFHELNTPVTKGKILAELVDDPKTRTMLDSIFSRLTSLLRELAQMEKLISEDTQLERKPVRIVELIDQARDLLFIEEDISTDITDETIEADFATMSIAFKNLIDNARKYGKNLTIRLADNGVEFVSEGAPLTHPLSYYIEPFSAGDTRTNEGFGLGLYIVNEIVKKHGMELRYRHWEGKNIFSLIISD
jgi:two-component system OmpR family sensor kinase